MQSYAALTNDIPHPDNRLAKFDVGSRGGIEITRLVK
jgi:hypothetical protein